MPRQAVVLIHGMGAILPMTLLRGSWLRHVPVWPHTRHLDGFARDPGVAAHPGTAVGLLRSAVGLGRGDLVQAAFDAARRKVDINRATLEQLQVLPGVGEAIARRIVAHRTARPGGFRSVAELEQVAGLGPSTVRRIVRMRIAVAGK